MANLPAKGLQEIGIWKELEDAINERRIVLGQLGTFHVPGSIAGEVCLQSGLASIQAQIEVLCGWRYIHIPNASSQFVNYVEVSSDWDNQPFIRRWKFGPFNPSQSWSMSNICLPEHANVGDGNLWTRVTGTSGNIVKQYESVQTGDYVGIYQDNDGIFKIAECLNEMYRILDLLRYTTVAADPFGAEIAHSKATWTELVAVWPPNPFPTDTDLGAQVRGHIARESNFDSPFQGIWPSASGISVRAKYRAIGINTQYAHAIDFYIYTMAPNGQFDGHIETWDDDGLGFFENRWNRTFSVSATFDSEVLTDYFVNDISLQDRPIVPPPLPPKLTNSRGWVFNTEPNLRNTGIVKWDVAGGFSKIS